MDYDVTVDIDPKDVLEEMEVKDILKYCIENKADEFTKKDINDFADFFASSTNLDLPRVMLEKLDPMEILTTVSAQFVPRNCTDRQSVLDGIQEYLSRI